MLKNTNEANIVYMFAANNRHKDGNVLVDGALSKYIV